MDVPDIVKKETGRRTFELILKVREHQDSEKDDGNVFVVSDDVLYDKLHNPVYMKGFIRSLYEGAFLDSEGMDFVSLSKILAMKENRILEQRKKFEEDNKKKEGGSDGK